MFEALPKQASEALTWRYADYSPYFENLLERSLTQESLPGWIRDWTQLSALVQEVDSRLYIDTTRDTEDADAQRLFYQFLEEKEEIEKADQKVVRKLVESDLRPDDYDIPMRDMQADVELFREENLPLSTKLAKLGNEYDSIAGAQTIQWDDQERTISQMRPLLLKRDRVLRERAWQAIADRQLADRDKLNGLWQQMLSVRREVAANADMPDFRAYTWKAYHRFDYTPEDSLRLHKAIERKVVPAVMRLLERRKASLGLSVLRPWDMSVGVYGDAPLEPFQEASALIAGGAKIFENLDSELAAYYHTMRDEALLDLDNRKAKAPGGYCIALPTSRRSFIFMNAVGVHDDLQTLLHEAGHAFHGFEVQKHQAYYHQWNPPIEFAEVASMAMELLAGPYLVADRGGFYNHQDAARARLEHLEGVLTFWPYMAVVDALQHWAYTHPDEAADPANMDAKWASLWDRFMPGVDWTGLEAVRETGWQRKLHIFQVPFYYIEYGLAQLGAVQVWRHALVDPSNALAHYRHALSLGNTRSLPDLYEAAGAQLAFDDNTLGAAVNLIETEITNLESQLHRPVK